MTILLTKLTDREKPEHWRIIIQENGREIICDSATNRASAIYCVIDHLKRILSETA